jgi:hypothetical protein
MPYIELLLHLSLTGDGIFSQVQDRHEGRIITDKGEVYVRSREGQELVQTAQGLWWQPKFLWCRV